LLCGWEGNHKSGVRLASASQTQWYIHLRALWPWQGDEHHLSTMARYAYY